MTKLTKHRYPDPTPEQDAAARAKEAAEQAALPYKWTQTIAELDVVIPSIPGNLKGRDLVVELKKQKIKAGIKGQAPIIDVRHISRTQNPETNR